MAKRENIDRINRIDSELKSLENNLTKIEKQKPEEIHYNGCTFRFEMIDKKEIDNIDSLIRNKLNEEIKKLKEELKTL